MQKSTAKKSRKFFLFKMCRGGSWPFMSNVTGRIPIIRGHCHLGCRQKVVGFRNLRFRHQELAYTATVALKTLKSKPYSLTQWVTWSPIWPSWTAKNTTTICFKGHHKWLITFTLDIFNLGSFHLTRKKPFKVTLKYWLILILSVIFKVTLKYWYLIFNFQYSVYSIFKETLKY